MAPISQLPSGLQSPYKYAGRNSNTLKFGSQSSILQSARKEAKFLDQLEKSNGMAQSVLNDPTGNSLMSPRNQHDRSVVIGSGKKLAFEQSPDSPRSIKSKVVNIFGKNTIQKSIRLKLSTRVQENQFGDQIKVENGAANLLRASIKKMSQLVLAAEPPKRVQKRDTNLSGLNSFQVKGSVTRQKESSFKLKANLLGVREVERSQPASSMGLSGLG